jgi:D-alanine-D-alanine ligase
MQRIGMLRGGVGEEYSSSLKTGAHIMEALRGAGYDVVDMLIDREGVLHLKGVPITLENASAHVDMVWNAIHGAIGEDGHIQGLLDDLKMPYSGSGALASAMTINKMTAKDRARELGIKSPEVILVMPEGEESISEITQNIYRRMAPPWVVKPLVGGASIHTYFAFTPLELSQFVEESISHKQSFIVEQYIYGREASVGVIDDFRGQERYVLPIVEIKSAPRGILTTEDRQSDDHAVVGGSFRSDEREMLSGLARDLHKHLGVNDFSQSEFIVDKQGKIWYLETDTVPHMAPQSAFVKALKSVGSSVEEFVTSIITRKS